MDWTALAIVVLAIFAAGANVAVIARFRGSPKNPLRVFNVLAVLYFAGVYILVSLGRFDISALGTTYLRPANGVLLALIAAYAIADWNN